MVTTVSEIFNRFDLTIHGQVKWNTEINSDRFGVNWIELIKSSGKILLVDGETATTRLIKQRLSQFWFPDETIVYIGKVGPTKGRTFRQRLNEYYQTKLGCNKWHAGGHWINALKNISDLNIYYSVTDPLVEQKMIRFFCDNVSNETKSRLYDNVNCFPFANKELNKSIRKKRYFSNQTTNCGDNWKKGQGGN